MSEAPPTATSPTRSDTDHLVAVIQDLSMARSLGRIQEIVRQAARRLTGADGATFVLRDGEQCFYADEDAIAPLWKGRRFPMSACISGWAMLNKRSVAIADIFDDPRIPADAYRPTFVKSLAMVPIRTQEPVGAIGTYWAALHRVSQEELRLLQALADSTSIALENVRLLDELRDARDAAESASRLKAPREGQVCVSIASAGERTRITVRDTGEGIPAEFVPHVFDLFRQRDGSITRAAQGLGLGLALVRHLVELHGGTVGVESPGSGRGTTFTVTLPSAGGEARAHSAS